MGPSLSPGAPTAARAPLTRPALRVCKRIPSRRRAADASRRAALLLAPCAAGASATRLGPGIRSQTLLDRREALPDRVLGHRARLDELEQVVRAAGLGADAREAVAAEGLAADARPGDGAVHIEVPGAELVCRAPDAHRRAREEAARERVVGAVGERERVLEVVGAEH